MKIIGEHCSIDDIAIISFPRILDDTGIVTLEYHSLMI